MRVNELIHLIESKIMYLGTNLIKLQNSDGGFKGYHIYDRDSGIWTTSEIVHILLKLDESKSFHSSLDMSRTYLLVNQNEDGGWPFRSGGKSITDITAWTCLALREFEEHDAIKRGLGFILKARYNEFVDDEGGWGLTNYEPDRIYSTWISIHCLLKYVTADWLTKEELDEIDLAISSAKDWIISSKNKDGGWGARTGEPSNTNSTAISLLTLFMLGEDPNEYMTSHDFIVNARTEEGLWELKREIVITKEGYELSQEWFTSIFCFRALIYFSELGLNDIKIGYNALFKLLDLIDDWRVSPAFGASNQLIWPIPFLIEGLDKYRNFVLSQRTAFSDFLIEQENILREQRKKEIEGLLRDQFPFPISQVFTSFNQELDYHRKFQLLLQLYEVVVKYAGIVNISYLASLRTNSEALTKLLKSKLSRPSFGDWIKIMITSLELDVNKIITPSKNSEVLKKLENSLDRNEPKLTLNQSLSKIVKLRNSWSGHGAVRSVYEYKLEIENQLSQLYTFLNRTSYLAKCNSFLILASDYNEFGDGDIYKIRVFNGLDILDNDLETPRRLAEGQRDEMIRYIYFHNTKTNTIANLYPFISYMFCESCKRERFFFYNSFNGNKIEYLSFECGHFVNRENVGHLEKRISSIGINKLDK